MSDAAILVVDDDAPIRRMLDRTLAAEGYAVEVAADGGAALAAVERSVPDLVVLDVGLPGLDGIAVCRRLRAKGLAFPVLMLTARVAGSSVRSPSASSSSGSLPRRSSARTRASSSSLANGLTR